MAPVAVRQSRVYRKYPADMKRTVVRPVLSERTVGSAMIIGAAAAFGTAAVLIKFAYAAGFTAEQMLAIRFVLAAGGLLVLAIIKGQLASGLGASRLLLLFGLGALGYAGVSECFALALHGVSASLAELIAYIYPALVALGGWTFLGKSIGRRHALGLVMTFVGIIMLVGGARLNADVALVFALAAPALYAAYVLVGERLMERAPALLASAAVNGGAGISFSAIVVARGQFHFPPNSGFWLIPILLAVIPSMIGITLFMAGLPKVGANRAALLNTFEPVVTILLAVTLLGDRLAPLQLLGALIVLAAIGATQVNLWSIASPVTAPTDDRGT